MIVGISRGCYGGAQAPPAAWGNARECFLRGEVPLRPEKPIAVLQTKQKEADAGQRDLLVQKLGAEETQTSGGGCRKGN